MANNNSEHRHEYWRANLKLMGILLVIWFTISYLCGIIFVDELNSIRIGGYKLGFWFAQQGSMYGFIVLIFVYAKLMKTLDQKYNVHD